MALLIFAKVYVAEGDGYNWMVEEGGSYAEWVCAQDDQIYGWSITTSRDVLRNVTIRARD